jgi:uncharacterized Zn finger protein (UPF0148 family)
MTSVQHECYICRDTKPDYDFVLFSKHPTDHCCRSCLVAWFAQNTELLCPICRAKMVVSDTIVISNAERRILKQYRRALIRTYKKRLQLCHDLNEFIVGFKIGVLTENPLYIQYQLSIDTAIATQLSNYDMFEARLRSIHRDDDGEFIGLDALYELFKTRLLSTGTSHTL